MTMYDTVIHQVKCTPSLPPNPLKESDHISFLVSSPAFDDEEAVRCYPIRMSVHSKKAKKFWAIVALLVMVSMIASMSRLGY